MADNLRETFLLNCPFESEYRFRECRTSDKILSKFTLEDWQKIVSWIRSEKELFSYIQELPYSMATLVYASKKTDEPLNFILLLRDHPQDHNVISFHGGGWSSPFINFRTGRQLLQTLLRCGFKVRTSVNIDNKVAQRFVEALGMKKTTRKDDVLWYEFPSSL